MYIKFFARFKNYNTKILIFSFFLSFFFRFFLYYLEIFDTWGMTADSQEYINIAKSIKENFIIGENGNPGMNRTPGYPFLIYLSFLFGQDYYSIIIIQFLIDSLSCVLIVSIAQKIKIHKYFLYLLIFLLSTCLYTTIYAGQIMTETLYSFLIILSFWILCRNYKNKFFLNLSFLYLLFFSFIIALIILVRPVFSIIIFVTFFLLFVCDYLNKYKQKVKILVKYLLATFFVLIFLSPWVVRNLIIFKDIYKIPNNDIVTILGFKTDYNMWKIIYNKSYQKFVKSYNEPLLILNPVEEPVVAKYVYKNEKSDVEKVFLKLKKIPEIINGRSSFPLILNKEITDSFETIAKKRYSEQPSLYLTAPLSRILKMIFAPRIASFYKNQSGFNIDFITFVFFFVYNFFYVFFGLLLIIYAIFKFNNFKKNIIFCYSFGIIIGHLYVYTEWVPLVQSRYLIPILPIILLLGVYFGNIVLSKIFSKFKYKQYKY